jgi:hypothetical protein
MAKRPRRGMLTGSKADVITDPEQIENIFNPPQYAVGPF